MLINLVIIDNTNIYHIHLFVKYFPSVSEYFISQELENVVFTVNASPEKLIFMVTKIIIVTIVENSCVSY